MEILYLVANLLTGEESDTLLRRLIAILYQTLFQFDQNSPELINTVLFTFYKILQQESAKTIFEELNGEALLEQIATHTDNEMLQSSAALILDD